MLAHLLCSRHNPACCWLLANCSYYRTLTRDLLKCQTCGNVATPIGANSLGPVLCALQATQQDVLIIAAAAFLANVFESYLGAAVQGRVEWFNNDLVNVIQITVAAALAVTAKYYL